MKRPVVGVIANQYQIENRYPTHAGGTINSSAVADVAGYMPLIIPADARYVSVAELLETCDGFLLTGGRPNVHPEEYGEAATEAHGAFDRARDAITLPLARACIERGQPILGICRGFQEVNVAMGGTLHPEIRDLPGVTCCSPANRPATQAKALLAFGTRPLAMPGPESSPAVGLVHMICA